MESARQDIPPEHQYDEQFGCVLINPREFFTLQENGLPERLRPSQVYFSIIGIFETEKPRFRLESTVLIPGSNDEYGRVYREVEKNKLHIIYKPGKDNDFDITIENPNPPLKEIITFVDSALVKSFTQEELNDALKLFVIGASNYYYWKPVRHYIYGCYSSGILTTVDSILWAGRFSRDYDLSYLKDVFNPSTHNQINRGYQAVWDNASCGHYVIAEMVRYIKDAIAPTDNFKITDQILDEHYHFYVRGMDSKVKRAMEPVPKNSAGWGVDSFTLSENSASMFFSYQEDTKGSELRLSGNEIKVKC